MEHWTPLHLTSHIINKFEIWIVKIKNENQLISHLWELPYLRTNFTYIYIETQSINLNWTTHMNPNPYREGKIENGKFTNLMTNYLPTYQ
jgi:hypothetical protein